jgi:pimeloyl-ACP methyl ester carboxylesterase
MSDTIVLLHGSATGSSSWDPVARSLVSSGASVLAPDMLGYGQSPAPTSSYGIAEEIAHLARLLDVGTLHLVTHSLGALIGLHLRRTLGARVTRMTLIDPVVVSVLRERGEDAAYAEMEEQYQRFMSLPRITRQPRGSSWITGAAPAHGIRWESGHARWLRLSFRSCGWR